MKQTNINNQNDLFSVFSGLVPFEQCQCTYSVYVYQTRCVYYCCTLPTGNIISLCLGENQITAYAGTYHTNSRVGGMIIAGGLAGSEQYDPICPVPYGGGVTCSTTSGGVHAWSCGQRFDWEQSSPLTYTQLLAEASDANCDQVGDSANYYSIGSSRITWNKVVIPVEECGPNINYALVTTADSCDDVPWRNVWANVECVPGDPTTTPGTTPKVCSLGITCPANLTVSANSNCQANIDVASLAVVSSQDCSNVVVSQNSSVLGLGGTTVVVTATADGGFSTQCDTGVTVEDHQSPVIVIAGDAQLECDEDSSVAATGSGSASDNCLGTVVTHSDTVLPGVCPQDWYIQRQWVATDVAGNVDTAIQHIHVMDSTPPVQVQPEPTCLWPPNHKFKCFDAASSAFVTGHDNCGSVVSSFSSCDSNQPANANGDGNTSPDCYYDAANDSLCFRAERQGGDPQGRVYTANFTAQDECGNSAMFSREVTVPHDFSEGSENCVEGTIKLDNSNGKKKHGNGKSKKLRGIK